MDLQLKSRRAVVTGATAGIGREIALALAEEGVNLALVGRRRSLLEEVSTEAFEAGAERVLAIELDMAQEDGPRCG